MTKYEKLNLILSASTLILGIIATLLAMRMI